MLDSQKSFSKFIKKIKPFGAKCGICIIDLETGKRLNYNENKFIYPASTYKIFIGSEVMRQIESGKLKLSQKIKIKAPNTIDNESRFYYVDYKFPTLMMGSEWTIDNLMKVMLGRSDNMASNVLIDVVRRENISKNIINKNGWMGSDVTRKFLNRIYENKKYRYADITVTCAKHLAEFIQKLDNNELAGSKNLREYMTPGKFIPELERVGRRAPKYHLTNVLYKKSGFIQILTGGGIIGFLRKIRNRGIIRYQSDAALIKIGTHNYAVGIVSQYRTYNKNKYFEFSKISEWLNK
ncbi:MAG: class A beta-lactamase-related serine hydrolase [Rickettsiales bacterium]|jgi:beta-lactamase class A|nr:class A beta-lactamase-related serine hydrolase [Rickettsiales bacterium]